jgi:RimJ/RimL family protein N-acetyltransferase
VTEIRTERLTLSDVTLADDEFILELLNDPGWLKNIGDRGVRTIEDARAYITDRFGPQFWLLVRDPAGERVGVCGIINRDGLDHPDIGYAYLERHSGKGYATEAAAAVLRHARETMGHRTIVAITAPDNTPSQRVLEKIGLRFVQMIDLPGHDGPSAFFTT